MSLAGGRFSSDVEGTGCAANEALDDARTVGATLFYISLALIFVALSTRHEDLFLDQALTVVKLNLLVKPSSFYTYAPVGFLLLQVFLYYKLIIARTAVRAFHELSQIQHSAGTPGRSCIDALHPGKLRTLLDPRAPEGVVLLERAMLFVTLVLTPVLVQALLFLVYLPTHHYHVLLLQAVCIGFTTVFSFLCLRVGARGDNEGRDTASWTSVAIAWVRANYVRRVFVLGVFPSAAVLAIVYVSFDSVRKNMDVAWGAATDAIDPWFCSVAIPRNDASTATRHRSCFVSAWAGADPKTLKSYLPFPLALNLSGHTLGRPESEALTAAQAVEKALAEIATALRSRNPTGPDAADNSRLKGTLSSTDIDDYDDLVRLRGRNFPWLNMREARLHGLDLSYSTLSDIDLTGAVLRKVVIRNDEPMAGRGPRPDCALLQAAPSADNRRGFTTRMNSVIATGVDWSQSTWEFADFSGSQWIDAKLQSIKFRCVTFFPGGDPIAATVKVDGGSEVKSFRGSDLTGADLSAPNSANNKYDLAFENVDLRSSVADQARFSSRSMRNAIFAYSSLRGSNFDGVHGDGLDFRCADLTGASFTGAQLPGARFEGAILKGTLFDGARLAGSVFGTGAGYCDRDGRDSLLAVSFNGADLSGSMFIGVNLSSVDFNNANLDFVLFRNTTVERVSFNGVDSMKHAAFMQQRTGGFIPMPLNLGGGKFYNWWNGFIDINAASAGTFPFRSGDVLAMQLAEWMRTHRQLASAQRPGQLRSKAPEEWRKRADGITRWIETFDRDVNNQPVGDWRNVRPPDDATARSRGREIGSQLRGLTNPLVDSGAHTNEADPGQRTARLTALVALACYRYGGIADALSVYEATRSEYERVSPRAAFNELVAGMFHPIGPKDHYLNECIVAAGNPPPTPSP